MEDYDKINSKILSLRAVGLGCGAGQMPLAALATGIVVSVIFLLRQLERLWGTH